MTTRVSTNPFTDVTGAQESVSHSSLSRTPWKVSHDYGMLFYSPASCAHEHLQLHHHLLGVEINPGIVSTCRNGERQVSNVILAGALYFVAAGSRLEVRKEQPMEYLLATVEPSLVETLFDEHGARARPTGFSFNLTDASLAKQAIELRRLFLNRDHGLPDAASMFVHRALTRLLTGDCSSVASRARYQLTRQRLRASLDFINDNLGSDLSVEAIAKEAAGASGYHFAHAFSAALGVSPYQYILDRRVSRARELLARTERPVADIAYAVGFSSQAHMTSMFCKRLGITPAKFRSDH